MCLFENRSIKYKFIENSNFVGVFLFSKSLYSNFLHQLPTSSLNYFTTLQYHNFVRFYELGHTEVMCDNNEGIFWRFHSSNELGNHTERVDVEPAFDLVEDDVARIQEFHLKNLDLTFLPARKPNIEVAIQKLLGNTEFFRESC